MFKYCAELKYVKCLATDISAAYCVYDWLGGVAASGVFIKAEGMNDWSSGSSGIPSGWTVDLSTINGHEFVDLGLSVKWATCNVGATTPEEYGDYFAWGETEPKSDYEWGTYKWMQENKSDQEHITKYTIDDGETGAIWYSGGAFVGDGKTTFADYDYADDAARANWGGTWRTPTIAEWDWLIDNCTWEWTYDYLGDGSNRAGNIGTSIVNGNQIFLPAAGHKTYDNFSGEGANCLFWSSSLSESYSYSAQHIIFYYEQIEKHNAYRYAALSVRPVTE